MCEEADVSVSIDGVLKIPAKFGGTWICELVSAQP
jgi:hypothetical protein